MTALSGLDGRRDVHGLVAGRVVRLLADGEVLSSQQAAARFAAALSVGVQAADKARWAEGFLSGSGLLLAHDRDLLGILDGWVASLSEQEFLDVLPLLRRTFGEFAAPERSSIGRAVRHLLPATSHRRGGVASAPQRGGTSDADEIDAERAAGALRTVAMILARHVGRGSMNAQDPAAPLDPASPRTRPTSTSGCGAGGCCSARPPTRVAPRLSSADQAIDAALAALYNDDPGRSADGKAVAAPRPGSQGGPPGWARPPRRWRAGWATSAPTSRRPSSR